MKLPRLKSLAVMVLVFLAIGFAIKWNQNFEVAIQTHLLAALRPDQPALKPHTKPLAMHSDLQVSPTNHPQSVRIELPAQNADAQFRAWTKNWLAVRSARPVTSKLLAEGEKLALERRAEIKQLIRTDPRAALNQAVSEVTRLQLPASIQAALEKKVRGEGALDVFVACDFKGGTSQVSREARIAGKSYQAFVYGDRLRDNSLSNVEIHGIAVDDVMAVAESSIEAKTPDDPQQNNLQGAYYGDQGGGTGPGGPIGASSWTQGTKKVLVMRVAFPDDATEPATASAAYAMMDQVNQFYQENSYGTTAMITDVTPLLILSQSKTTYGTLGRNALQTDAREAARLAGMDTANYDLDIVMINPVSGVSFDGWAGIALIGGKGVWIQGTTSAGVAAHELGHNYGLHHANFWNASSDSIIGPGSTAEYGGPFDTMGSPFQGGVYHFNVEFKHELDWMPSSFVQTVTSSGTYRIYAQDVPNLVGGEKFALRIKKDYVRDYWAEYRQKIVSNPWTQSGIILNWGPFNNLVGDSVGGTTMLDTTPGSPAGNSGKDDAPVVIGRTFSDRAAGIHFTPIAKGTSGSEHWIDVKVNLGAFVGNTVPVFSSMFADQTSVATGTPVNFTASASDADGDALAYYWEFSDPSSGTTFGPNSPTASKSWSTAGEYSVRCVVSDMKGGVASRSVVITVGSLSTFRVSGQITVGGVPLEGVRVHNGGGSVATYQGAYTDSAGNFTLANLSAGSFTLSALKYGFDLTPNSSTSLSVGPDLSGQDWTATTAPIFGVTIADAAASEAGPDTGTFTISRSGSLSSSLTLKFNLSGPATYSTDYSLAPAPSVGSPYTLTMDANVASVNIVLTPVTDALTEGPETAVLTLFEDSAYTLGSFSEGTIAIADSQSPATPTVTVTAPDDLAPESGSDSGVFQFTRSNTGVSDLTVHYSTSGTATSLFDYTALSGSAVIPAGTTSVLVPFTVIDDGAVEGNETVIVTVSSDAAYTVGTPSAATVTIVDDDPVTVTIAATDSDASEVGGNSGAFTVSRYGSLAANLVVNYSMGGSATSGTDYTALSGSVTILAGQSTASFNLSPIDDSLVEGTETAVASLTSSSTYNIGNPGSATVYISDDETPSITLSVTSSNASESGSPNGEFTFARSGSTAAPLTVHYSIAGSAINGVDYTTITDSIIIPIGQSSATLAILATADTIREASETVALTLKSDDAYSVTTSTSQTVTIIDNNTGDLPGIGFALGQSSGSEGGGAVKLVVNLTASSASSVTVNCSQTGGTATIGIGGDFLLQTTSLTFNPGDISKTINLFVFQDSAIEFDETVILTLNSPSGAVLAGNTSHTYTIIDDDSAPATTVTALDASASETGPDTGTFRISRSGSTAADETVTYQVTGSASSPSDYASLGNSIVIPAGSDHVDLVVAPVDDNTPEPLKTVIITLLTVSEKTIGTPKTATITIADNEPVPASPVVERQATQRVKLPVSSMLGTDPNGDSLSLQSVDAQSANGGIVSQVGSWVFYTPAIGFTNDDRFNYVVSDGHGGVGLGTVTVEVKADNTASINLTGIANLGGGMFQIRFNGIPLRTYTIQYTTALAPPNTVWTTLGTTTIDSKGEGTYLDAAGSLLRVYRTVYP